MRKQAKLNIPSKTGINLAMRDSNPGDLRLLVIGSVLILLLAGAVAKFGVIDQYARLNKAASEYNSVHSIHQSMTEALKDYKKVETEYRTHSMDWMKDDAQGALVRVDRMLVLDLMEQELMTKGTVTRMTVYTDILRVNMSGMTLAQISDMILSLQEQPIVARVELEMADTYDESDAGALLNFSLTILLQPEEVAQ